MTVPFWAWAAVLGSIVVMLAIDLFAHRRAHVIGVREAAVRSAVWVGFGIGFGVLIWLNAGAEFGRQYFAGYLIEKSLAVDNVFVWAIIFTYFAVPRRLQHRVLFLGVLGALVFRGLFIAAGSVLIASFGAILYLFAAFLILTGCRMLRGRDEHLDPERSRTLRLFRRYVPMTDALAVVTTIIGASIAASLYVTRGRGRQAPPVAAALFRSATPAELAAAAPLWGWRRTGAPARSDDSECLGDGNRTTTGEGLRN